MNITVLDNSASSQKTTQAPQRKTSRNSRSAGFKPSRTTAPSSQAARRPAPTKPATEETTAAESKPLQSADELLEAMDTASGVATQMDTELNGAHEDADSGMTSSTTEDDEATEAEEAAPVHAPRAKISTSGRRSVSDIVDDGPDDDEDDDDFEDEDDDDDDFRPGKTIGRRSNIQPPKSRQKKVEPAPSAKKRQPEQKPAQKKQPAPPQKRQPAPKAQPPKRRPVTVEDEDEDDMLVSRPANDKPGRPQVIVKQESFLSQFVVVIEVIVGAGLAFFGGTQIANILIQRLMNG